MQRKRILFVAERESSLVQGVTAQLAALDYATATVSDANEGWRLLTRESYDVIVMEVENNNAEACLVCRMLRRRWHKPIVVLSHSSDKQAEINSYLAGADVYLQAPFDVQELVARLEGLLRRAEWNSQARSQAVGVFAIS